MMMKPTDFRHRDHPPLVSRVDWARLRTIHRQRQMRPPPVIRGQVASQDALQMLLVQDDHMIQTVSPDAPNEAFHIGILPW